MTFRRAGHSTSYFALAGLLFQLNSIPSYAAGTLLTGADRAFQKPYLSWFDGKRIGLITNQTGVTSKLEALPTLFAESPETELAALFAPEHGIAGTAQAGEKIESTLQVFSLYGKHRRPTRQMLSGIEILVFDIQDVGARFYTYASTLLECMKAAADSSIPFVVLDRPNPISGVFVEGPILEPELESFIGIARLPIRHGMTPGEMAILFKADLELDLDLRIVPLSGWYRKQWFDETGLIWIAPSPNMPTLETATVYPGLCLVEGTNLSEGRGTTLPFELIGAPWLHSTTLANRLNHLSLKGVLFRPHAFTPTFSKYTGQLCSGIQVHVLDRTEFRPIRTALHILRETKLQHPNQFRIDGPRFDRLSGNRWIREMLEKGAPVDSITDRWSSDLEAFKVKRKEFLLY
jgi:uncharacterized protein YbbC (DUF1343 family)